MCKKLFNKLQSILRLWITPISDRKQDFRSLDADGGMGAEFFTCCNENRMHKGVTQQTMP